MNCREFRRRWNDLLDAEPGPAGGAPVVIEELEALLLAHSDDCPACRPIAARYQALRLAIRAWKRPPEPPADLVDRVLSAPTNLAPEIDRSPRRPWRDQPVRVRWAAAIAAAALLTIALEWASPRHPPRPAIDAPLAVRDPGTIPKVTSRPPAFDRALADATSATWDLARSASGPAARIGREFLDATVSPGDGEPGSTGTGGTGEGLARLSVTMPDLDPIGGDPSSAFQRVGDQLSEGVRPLSESARHAFGFLLGSPSPRAATAPGATPPNGARSG